MNFEQVKQQEQANMMHTYGRFPVALVKGKGVTAWDTEGKDYIDFTSGIGVNALGWCDEGWVQAVSRQAGELQHISNLYYNPVQTQLAEALCKASGLSKVFFGNSGAEANECAIKLARKWGMEQSPEKNRVVTLQNSFHGRTVTTLAATGQDEFHQWFFPFTEGFDYAPANDLAAVEKAITEKTCAVMVELIQGEGGMFLLEKDFVQGLRKLCDEKNVLLLVDEVQTGIGRTGAFYCYQNFDILPDVVSSAKGLGGGLPIGACLCGEKLQNVMTGGMHGSTFGGNPIVCAGALEVLSRVNTPEFLAEVNEKGEYFREKLAELPHIENVRGMGLMIGADVAKDCGKTAGNVASACIDAGLLILTAHSALRFLPPLTITKEEIDEGLARLKTVLEAL
ncbi:MAG TPA: aspartate aminotransferase family protein [Candidatus Gallacutalibacter pullistercoris]|nr:aspartate aminotransferase family protein [Candidatus Gallacutalibacter pullistercoris]